jgi:hypothetical protein
MLTDNLHSSCPNPDDYDTKTMWAAALVAHNPSFTVKDFQDIAESFGLDPHNTSLWYTAVRNWRKANGLGPLPRTNQKGNPKAANFRNPDGELSWKKGKRKQQQARRRETPEVPVESHPLGCPAVEVPPPEPPKEEEAPVSDRALPAAFVSNEVTGQVGELQRWMRTKGIKGMEIDASGEVRLSNMPRNPKGPSFVVKRG